MPILRAATTGGTGAAGTASTFTVAQPTGLAPGDLCLIWCAGGGATLTFTITGFTAVAVNQGNNQSLQLFYRLIDGTESWPITVTLSTANVGVAVCYAATNSDGSLFDPTPTSGTTNVQSTTVAVPGVTTTAPLDLAVWFACNRTTTAGAAPSTITNPGGSWTNRVTQVNTSSAGHTNEGAICADSTTIAATPGTIATQNGTLSAGAVNGGVLVSIRSSVAVAPIVAPAYATTRSASI